MQPQVIEDGMDMDVLSAEEQQARIDEQLQSLGGRLKALAEEQVKNKGKLEQRWLEDLRQVHGKVSAAESKALSDAKKSSIVVNITRNKSNAGEARLVDLAAPTDTRHWGVKPTPVPELQELAQEARPTQLPNGQPVPAQELAKQKIKQAKERAEKMEQEIDDQLTEAKFNPKMRQMIHDCVRLGTGIIKGPVVVGRSRRAWSEVEKGSGVFSLDFCEDLRPGVEVVSPWNFFPDMRACRIEEAEFVFERKFLTKKMLRNLAERPGYLVDQIKELLRDSPSELSISDTHTDEMREISGVDTVPDDNRYELWEYHGEISPEDLIAAGCEVDEDNPLEVYSGIVEFCGSRVIRVLISPMDTGDCIYSVANWERDNSSIFGYGIPYLMRGPQKVINASFRMMMDNAGLCVGGQIVIDKDKVTPADGKWELAPRKVWWYSNNKTPGRVSDAFALHEIASHQAELTAILPWRGSLRMRRLISRSSLRGNRLDILRTRPRGCRFSWRVRMWCCARRSRGWMMMCTRPSLAGFTTGTCSTEKTPASRVILKLMLVALTPCLKRQLWNRGCLKPPSWSMIRPMADL